jgi:hypothetical protein
MSARKPLGNTGKAPVVRQGHTESGSFGTSGSKQPKGPRTLKENKR